MSPALAVLLAVALGWVALRLGLLALLALSHWRYAAYARFKGHRVSLAGWALLIYLWREAGAMLTVGRWWLLDRAPIAPPSPAAGRPVVLIHGFTQNGSNFAGLKRRLRARGRPTLAPNLGAPFLGGLERYTGPLEAALDEARRRSPDGRLDVVAHSMGGLVLRMLLARRLDLAPHLRVVITLGAPHLGTAAARGFAYFQDAGAMRRSSPLYKDLPCLAELLPRARVLTVAAAVDYVVYPLDTCHHGGTESRTFERPGHTGLLVDPEVAAVVLDALCADEDVGMAEPAPSV